MLTLQWPPLSAALLAARVLANTWVLGWSTFLAAGGALLFAIAKSTP